MFPLIGILVAAALLFAKRKKPSTVGPAVSVKAAPTTTKAPVKTTSKPVATTPKTPAKTPTKLPVSSIQGLPLPSAGQVTSDLFGSMLGTNPKVLAPSLPYGYYNTSTNSTGNQTPPVVAPIYR